MQVLNRDDPRSMRDAHPGPHGRDVRRERAAGEGEWGLVRFDGDDVARARRRPARAVGALALVGRHNALNALAALALASTRRAHRPRRARRADARSRACRTGCSAIAEAGGVVYIDDSKGTNVGATLAALDGIERPAVLIAGGDGKGQDFAPLKSRSTRDCRAVLLIGRDAPLHRARRSKARRRASRCVGTLDAAVDARDRARASPATRCCCRPRARASTSSANYVERGERFAARVHARLDGARAHA